MTQGATYSYVTELLVLRPTLARNPRPSVQHWLRYSIPVCIRHTCANSPDAPTLLPEQRRVILRSGSYNFVVPDGPRCHQSHRDVINRRAGLVSSSSSGPFEVVVSVGDVPVGPRAPRDIKIALRHNSQKMSSVSSKCHWRKSNHSSKY